MPASIRVVVKSDRNNRVRACVYYYVVCAEQAILCRIRSKLLKYDELGDRATTHRDDQGRARKKYVDTFFCSPTLNQVS